MTSVELTLSPLRIPKRVRDITIRVWLYIWRPRTMG